MSLLTPWGEALDPDQVLPEYPRPQLVRESYLNLNGYWDYAITPAGQTTRPRFDGRILVPFSPEAALSGVGRTLQPDEALWYRRSLALPAGFCRDRVLLHFGAVDSEAEVWVNDLRVGGHAGGFLPFSVDITDALGDGQAELLVRVRDLTDTSYRSRGKQTLRPGGIWYPAQSGIWQTVWLESTPASWIRDLELVPDLAGARLGVRVRGNGPEAGAVQLTLAAEGRTITATECSPNQLHWLRVPEVRPWSPEDPFCYDLEVRYGDDRVSSYAALRSVGLGSDAAGRTRLLLNGEPFLHAGLLDQGYWPDGLLTAPSDAALIHDVATAKDLGFTMLRKHIKVEPLRWYHHCDRLGMLVWQDLVNGGRRYRPWVVSAPAVSRLRLDDRHYAWFGRQDAAGREEFLAEAEQTIALLRNSPSVVSWVPFNEGWGQFDAAAVAGLVRRLDPSRLIDHASGWHDQGAGDMASRHVYFRPYRLSAADERDPRAAVLSEYGGYSHRVAGHVAGDTEFGYRRIPDRDAFQQAFLALQDDQLRPALDRGLAGFVYTQLADVEQETNGLLTYDRRVVKLDAEAVRASNARLRAAFATAIAPTSSPVTVTERELTAPVPLTTSTGHLNRNAIGWSRTPLVITDRIGHGRVGALRNKRWEYWAITTPHHVLTIVVSDIDYAGVSGLWLFDRATRTPVAVDVITPFGSGIDLPGTLGDRPATLRTRQLQVAITEVEGGTRIEAGSDRVRVDVLVHRPAGHECLGVVVPWNDRLFQYTVKDVARPASGTIWLDGAAHDLPDGEAWATLDHGRGRWPHRVHWNWGVGCGRTGGRVLGLQVGGKWTDGSGSTENALLADGRLHKINQELVWTYDTDDWLAPWQITGDGVDLVFAPEYDKVSATDLKLVSSHTHQCFGTWSGQVAVDGLTIGLTDLFGWAEDVHQRW
ncbi:MAG: DUF2804 family protein [Propionicimonas sp.]|uniref:DUF2804 family protein n=1 Tax=Propionicimonas sp. TaxID=1955623 RepID=UPI002B1F9B65|nr:DUF2804 family protein [Propionicimonas sp.]MEA4944326.1 DUF2804 family protein [Propionicimonas sp.]